MSESGFGGGEFHSVPGDGQQELIVPPEAFYIPQEVQPVLNRSACEPNQIVYLKQYCFTPNQVFPPGEYHAYQLPDVAFGMGMVIPPTQAILKIDKRERIEKVIDNEP